MIGRQSLACTRKAISMDHGRVVESDDATFSILASVQPLIPAELMLLPEGRRQNKSYKLFTNDTLYCFGDKDYNPDQVTIDGEQFETFAPSQWNNGIINHNVYIVCHITAAA